MYMMRRVHAEQSQNSNTYRVWVYQYERENLSELIDLARFNLKPFNDLPGVTTWEDNKPNQKTLPGCVWNGRTDEIFFHDDNWHPRRIHTITQCMIFNVSKCWYSPVLPRETSECDIELHRFNTKVGMTIYPSFASIKECVDYLTSPEGLGVCSDYDIKPIG